MAADSRLCLKQFDQTSRREASVRHYVLCRRIAGIIRTTDSRWANCGLLRTNVCNAVPQWDNCALFPLPITPRTCRSRRLAWSNGEECGWNLSPRERGVNPFTTKAIGTGAQVISAFRNALLRPAWARDMAQVEAGWPLASASRPRCSPVTGRRGRAPPDKAWRHQTDTNSTKTKNVPSRPALQSVTTDSAAPDSA
jgi:hypothetical protein